MFKKKTWIFIVKLVVSFSLLFFIISKINWSKALNDLERADYFILIVVFLLFILERVELTYKWNILIRRRGIYVSFWRLFLINAIGGFWGLFLPSSLSTDIVRGYYLVKNNSEKSVSISSVFVDRILGMFSLLLMGTVSVIIAGDLLSNKKISLFIFLISFVITILFYFFQKDKALIFLEKVFKKVKYKKITDNVIKLHKAVLEYKKYPLALWTSFFITVLVQVTRVIIFYLIAIAFNVYFPIIYFFLFIPIIMIIIMIPISLGGLGIREGAFIAFFTLIGMSLSDAAVITFINSLLNTIVTLFGGVFYLFYKPIKDKNEVIISDNNNIVGEDYK